MMMEMQRCGRFAKVGSESAAGPWAILGSCGYSDGTTLGVVSGQRIWMDGNRETGENQGGVD